MTNGVYVKDLKKLNRELKDTIIVDVKHGSVPIIPFPQEHK